MVLSDHNNAFLNDKTILAPGAEDCCFQFRDGEDTVVDICITLCFMVQS